jgi:hypothetical protein
MLSVMFLAVCGVAAMVAVTLLVKRNIPLAFRWEGAFRHIVALLAAWMIFSFLSMLFLVMNLFETGNFSFEGLLHVVEIGLSLLIGGIVVVLMVLLMTKIFAVKAAKVLEQDAAGFTAKAQ